MQYGYRAALTLNNVGGDSPYVISDNDKKYIAMWYPFPTTDAGQLRNGDDCDTIDFKVEHGVENPSSGKWLITYG